MVFASGILRENDGDVTRLKQRMQTHGFLDRNEYKASDNVVEEGKVSKSGRWWLRGEWRRTMLTRAAH
jgi:hypothetical protein